MRRPSAFAGARAAWSSRLPPRKEGVMGSAEKIRVYLEIGRRRRFAGGRSPGRPGSFPQNPSRLPYGAGVDSTRRLWLQRTRLGGASGTTTRWENLMREAGGRPRLVRDKGSQRQRAEDTGADAEGGGNDVLVDRFQDRRGLHVTVQQVDDFVPDAGEQARLGHHTAAEDDALGRQRTDERRQSQRPGV